MKELIAGLALTPPSVFSAAPLDSHTESLCTKQRSVGGLSLDVAEVVTETTGSSVKDRTVRKPLDFQYHRVWCEKHTSYGSIRHHTLKKDA